MGKRGCVVPRSVGVSCYYDPTTGQFLTRDPISALTRSAYGYVGGNPLNGVDPSGLQAAGWGCKNEGGGPNDLLSQTDDWAGYVAIVFGVCALVTAGVRTVAGSIAAGVVAGTGTALDSTLKAESLVYS
ncbi:MAG: hypothetical protein HYX32_10365 [Actinobacteria bacterium]|nr:hypothetical protein [Actinomycetota bacterium]